ncbi:ribosome-associated heat shock protein Hsp15 [Citrobacter freundii]|nr:ribosome-associated heat shock protein Hsp15 [Citrobacter freundii]
MKEKPSAEVRLDKWLWAGTLLQNACASPRNG